MLRLYSTCIWNTSLVDKEGLAYAAYSYVNDMVLQGARASEVMAFI